DKAGNLILIGGPAVNTLVKDLLNNEWNVTDSQAAWLDHFSSGEAMIKLVEDAFGDGSLALIVAGTDAADTVEACHVLQQYDNYADEFADKTEVKVTTEAGTVNIV
ncbi:MAG: S-layer protein, partial [Candidatus Aenigmarchaeota archaeon]|nr:S-layer protein [Candidatus Aenigmarchaeota archaeon]